MVLCPAPAHIQYSSPGANSTSGARCESCCLSLLPRTKIWACQKWYLGTLANLSPSAIRMVGKRRVGGCWRCVGDCSRQPTWIVVGCNCTLSCYSKFWRPTKVFLQCLECFRHLNQVILRLVTKLLEGKQVVIPSLAATCKIWDTNLTEIEGCVAKNQRW